MNRRLRTVDWLFALFVFSIPFQSVLSIRISGFQLQPADLVFAVVLIVWLVGLLKRRSEVRLCWFHLFLAAYLIAVLLSAMGSADTGRSLVKLAGKLYLILIALVSFSLIDSLGRIQRSFYFWLGGAAIVLVLSVSGILGFYVGFTDPEVNIVIHPIYGSLPAGPYPRIEGLFAYPAMFSNFLGITWMIAIASTLTGWLRERNFWIFGGLLLFVNAFTLTPGLGGIFLSSGVLLYLIKRVDAPVFARSSLFAGAVTAVLFLAAAAFTLFSYDPDGINIPLADGEITASHRAQAWSTGFQTFLQFPILGKGVGMPVSEASYTDPNGNNQLLTDAHNTYISVLAETGVVGAAAFFGMLLFLVWKLIKSRSQARWIKICLLLAIADAVLYQGLTGSYEDARHLWVFFGIAAAAGLNDAVLGDYDAESYLK